jgi:hypothetical protein
MLPPWKAVLSLALLVTWAIAPASVRAEEEGDKAAAEALYQLAQRSMAEGKYAEACPKLDASNKLDPGVGTLLFLGECQEKLGKLASAWATFHQAMALAKARSEPDRAAVAEVRAAALQPRLSFVVFDVDSKDDMEGFELRRNGLLIASGSWGVPLPSDPGRFELVARAPGYDAWSTTLTVPAESSETVTVRVPHLTRAGSSARAADRRPMTQVAMTAPAERTSGTSSQKTWAVITFGVGTAAAIAGGALLYLAAQKNSDSVQHCRDNDHTLCSPQGVSQREDAKSLARLATIFGIGGGTVMATGATLYITAPSNPRGAPTGLTIGLGARF